MTKITYLVIIKGLKVEKRTAHYSLETIKSYIQSENYFITQTARQDSFSLGLDDEEVIEIILGLEPKNLYKSMTSYQNHKIWHDVYHKEYRGIELYIKLQLVDNAIIISFKERT